MQDYFLTIYQKYQQTTWTCFYIKYMFYNLNLFLYKIYVLAVLYLDFAITVIKHTRNFYVLDIYLGKPA